MKLLNLFCGAALLAIIVGVASAQTIISPAGLTTNNPTFTGTLTGPTYAGDVSNTTVVASGGKTNTLAVITNRIVSLDDAEGIHEDGVTDDTPEVQTLLNAVAAAGGGTVLGGSHRWAIGAANSALAPTSVSYGCCGFTFFLNNTAGYYQVGNSYTLSGFTAPMAELNGTWTAGFANSGAVIFYYTLSGGNGSSVTTGIGSVVENLVIPSNVTVSCSNPLSGPSLPLGESFSTVPYSFVVFPGATVFMQPTSAWRGCNLLSSAATINQNTATVRQFVQQQQALAGIGFTLLNTDSTIRDTMIAGFNVGISENYAARSRLENLKIDANTCISVTQSHDISQFYNISCGPFLTSNNSNQTVSYNVSSIANNGSGLWRVTLSAPTALITGDTIYLNGQTGAYSAAGVWIGTVINSTTVDLQGSSAAGTTFTGNTISGSSCINTASSTANMGVGSSISGSGIPTSDTITAIYPRDNTVCLAAAATGAASGTTFTVSDPAYSTGGTLFLDSTRRPGDGFFWSQSETLACINCTEYGHLIGFEAGDRSSWLTLLGSASDNLITEHVPGSIGYLIDGASVGTNIIGGSSNSVQTAVVVNSTGGGSHMIEGMTLNNVANTLELSAGRLILNGNSSASGGSVFVADGAGLLTYSANDFNSPPLRFQSNVGATKMLNGAGGIIPPLTVSTLPTCNIAAAGETATVIDALSPTYNAALAGSGSTQTLAVCNGSIWTAH